MESREVSFGRHRVRAEGRLLIVHFIGPVSLPEFRQICELGEEVLAAQGGIYLLAHVAQAGGMDPAVRRGVVDWATSRRVLGIVNIKAGMMTHGLASLLANAIRLISGRGAPVTFVATEQEARAWVEEQERKQPDRAPLPPK